MVVCRGRFAALFHSYGLCNLFAQTDSIVCYSHPAHRVEATCKFRIPDIFLPLACVRMVKLESTSPVKYLNYFQNYDLKMMQFAIVVQV